MSTATMKRYRNLIGGEWVVGAEEREIRSPATGHVVHTVPVSGEKQLDAAVVAARGAVDSGSWSWDPELRARVLFEYARLVRENIDALATELTRESGKVFGLAKNEARRLAQSIEYFAGITRWVYGRTISPRPDLLNIIVREPVGVVGAILPWNMPLGLVARTLGPALAAGNAIVIKPDELTAGSSAAALELLASIPDLPAGVVNLVAGGDGIGKAMTAHPDIDMIAFTGSSDTGKEVMRACAGTLKKLSLELGGKSPVVVFDDADLDRALAGTVEGAAFYHAGQICLAGTRVLVQDSLYDEFTDRLAERATNMRVGDGAERGVQCGPVISEAQLQRVLDYVEVGRGEAQLAAGGRRLTDGALADGYFVAPTVFRDVAPDARIAQEEIFGPVVSALRFSDLGEAAEIANGTRYGLAAGVFTRDIDKAIALARRVRAGTVWVNTYGQLFQNSEMGGMRESGMGRQYGLEGLHEYTELKNIAIGIDPRLAPGS
ncbi:MAG: aldehyde dehydrogenase family protein [Actinomycetota bacterium]